MMPYCPGANRDSGPNVGTVGVAQATEPRDGPSDEYLLAQIRAGETDRIEDLIKRYERELYGYLRRYLGRDDLAEEVFQATFVQVFRKIGQYEPGRPARPWLYAVATNQAIDAMRRRARRPDKTTDPSAGLPPGNDDDARPYLDLLPAPGPDPADELETDELRRRVRAAVDQLPDLFRSVVVLAYFQGLRLQDVGEVLGIPVGTVKSRMHAATAKLAELLAADEPAPPPPRRAETRAKVR
jgi:RNA polymerase sigma-70 factor (ECF subfamily)